MKKRKNNTAERIAKILGKLAEGLDLLASRLETIEKTLSLLTEKLILEEGEEEETRPPKNKDKLRIPLADVKLLRAERDRGRGS